MAKHYLKEYAAFQLRVWLVFLALIVTGCREQLMHNLSEQQANRLITRLHENVIESRKTRQPDGRWSVEVERNQLAQALREMQKLRLLRDVRATSSENSSVIASRDQQRFAFERALSSEVEQTLLSIEGVLEARVHLNLPQVDPLFGKSITGAQGSGSVFIIAEQELAFSREEFANLVAGAAGMLPQGISVLIEVDRITQPAPRFDPEPADVKRDHTENQVFVGPQEWRVFLQKTKSTPFIVGVLLIIFGSYLIRLITSQTKIKKGGI
jgi:type III secretion protein J